MIVKIYQTANYKQLIKDKNYYDNILKYKFNYIISKKNIINILTTKIKYFFN